MRPSGIYQASNWLFVDSQRHSIFVVNGRRVHNRTIGARFGRGAQRVSWLRAHLDPNAYAVITPPKHKYLFPLDNDMRRMVSTLARPYPKRAPSIDNDAPGDHPGEGGENPTDALQP